ncbi:hypothetical protein B9Z19DRAFT_1120386 [Tuber borchii]|uniref:peptidylprolyl isomerase n=1 Tax=Tuber borchii TaxID=42251 RepID=A0A2T7A4G6_TUBBO|nr:hypothetical protein B9Z19DRAFT_1120386 [Tuber borchii]
MISLLPLTPARKDEKIEKAEKIDKTTYQKCSNRPGEDGVIEGVKITDVRVGTGLMATKGAKLYVHCRGMVEGGVVFDDKMDGLPFIFVLGEGEVIWGWGIGLLGMRVGGERRLDIPPALCSGEEEEILGAPADGNWVYHVKLTYSE